MVLIVFSSVCVPSPFIESPRAADWRRISEAFVVEQAFHQHPNNIFLAHAVKQALSPPQRTVQECQSIRADSKNDYDRFFFGWGLSRPQYQTRTFWAHCDLYVRPPLTAHPTHHRTNAFPTSGAHHHHHLALRTGSGARASVEENRRKAIQGEEGEADQRCSSLDGDVERGRPDVVLPQRYDRREMTGRAVPSAATCVSAADDFR